MTIRRTSVLPAALALVAACGGGGPSSPNQEVRVYVGSGPGGSLHVFAIQRVGEQPTSFSCPGSVRLTLDDDGTGSGSTTIDTCQFAGVEEPITIPLQNVTLQGESLAFRLLQQDAIIESIQQAGCEIVESDQAFGGTATATSLDVSLQATVDCESEDIQGRFVITWRMQGTRSS